MSGLQVPCTISDETGAGGQIVRPPVLWQFLVVEIPRSL